MNNLRPSDDLVKDQGISSIVSRKVPIDQANIAKQQDSGSTLGLRNLSHDEQDKSSDRSDKSDRTIPMIVAEIDEDSSHTSAEQGKQLKL